MNDELKAAILIARAAALNAEVAGMVAENNHANACSRSQPYHYDSFMCAVRDNNLGENNLIMTAIHGELSC